MHYTSNLVAFIDVLGFRELVNSKDISRIQSYFSISKKVKDFWKKTPIKQEIEVITLSDSFVMNIKFPEAETARIETIREFFIAISLLQGELALNDIWTRGGVSLGDYYISSKDNIMFGPSMIAAYDLESKVAKYPRVVVDQKLISACNCTSAHEFIHKINSSLENSSEKWRNSILYPWHAGRDEINSFRKDYPLFIDYLAQFLEKDEELESIIDNLIHSSSKDATSYEKLKWVNDYLKMRHLGGKEKKVEYEDYHCSANGFVGKLDSF